MNGYLASIAPEDPPEGGEGDPVSVAVSHSRVQPARQAAIVGNRADIVAAAYEAHQRELMSFAYAVTRDHSAAEDLVQETFFRLVRELAAGRPPEHMRAQLTPSRRSPATGAERRS